MSEQQKKQISKLAGALTEHQNHFGGMSTEDRQWAIQNTKDAIALFVEAVKNRVPNMTEKLLELVTTTEVGGVASFIAEEKFHEGETTDGVKIVWLGSNFKQNFMEKKEKDIAPAMLRIQKLKKNSLDAPILTELGDKAETTLAHLWELLKKHGAGQAGPLLVNGYANIFYIRDKNGVLWAVNASWFSVYDGWHVEALSVEGPRRWLADFQVVSR